MQSFQKISAEALQHANTLFRENRISVTDWARANQFSSGLVYQILEGKRKCMRGQSHEIALALGLKAGATLTLDDLTAPLVKQE